MNSMLLAQSKLRTEYITTVCAYIVDVTTVKNLELLTNARDPSSSHSLYGILNYSKTIGGGKAI